jgi:two-component sensor histidine kinase/PAS domain-containing protein
MSQDDPKPPLFEDADETVQAIRQGDIDAVVVTRGLEGPQVILLHGAEEPYRVLVERMSDGALTAGPDGVILYVNDRLCELTGYPSARLVGRDLASLFEGEPPRLVPEVTAEAGLLRNGDDAVPVAVWSRPLSIGDNTATLVWLSDLSIHRRAQQIAAAERFARSVLEQATEAIVVLSPDGHITHASSRAQEVAEQPPVGCRFSEAFPLEAEATEEAATLARFSAESLDAILATKPFHGVEVKLRGERNAKSAFLLSAGPLFDDTKANVGSIVTLTDITERKRVEEQQTTMVAELNHRVKNILAIVQSVAAQTVRSSDSLEHFADAFAGRLRALAIAHDILTHTRWIGIGLGELLVAVLAPYRSPDETRVSIFGPAILLPARAVVPLSMVLHEMAINAAKYGALSTRRGNIEITWRWATASRSWSNWSGWSVADRRSRRERRLVSVQS